MSLILFLSILLCSICWFRAYFVQLINVSCFWFYCSKLYICLNFKFFISYIQKYKGFCMLAWFTVNLLYSIISSSHFYKFSFYTNNHVSYTEKQFYLFVSALCVILFTFLILLHRLGSPLWSIIVVVRKTALPSSNFNGQIFILSSLSMMFTLRFIVDILYLFLGSHFLFPDCWEIILFDAINGKWISSNAFSASTEKFIHFFLFMLLIQLVTLLIFECWTRHPADQYGYVFYFYSTLQAKLQILYYIMQCSKAERYKQFSANHL